MEERDVIIIGSGPAGLTAAIYAARASLNPLVLTGTERGGQITLTNEMENFPGFEEAISGFELAQSMEKQALKFGAEFLPKMVTKLNLSDHPFKICTDESEYIAKTLIISTGSSPRKLGVPGEKELVGKGVSYCATCDGFFFNGKRVVVVGGGNSALDESLFLTKFVKELYVIHRRDRLRADPILQERAFENEKIDFIWDSVVTKVNGEDAVTSVELKNVKTEETSTFETDGIFVYIGHIPNTDIFKDQIELDDHGYIVTDKHQRTNVKGVFAAGDVQDPIYRQAITSAGSGAIAAIEAEKFIAELEHRAYTAFQWG